MRIRLIQKQIYVPYDYSLNESKPLGWDGARKYEKYNRARGSECALSSSLRSDMEE